MFKEGTCNVCSAPCSSCMHLNQAIMGSKAEEYSDENCRLVEDKRYSTDEGDESYVRSRTCERLKHSGSETSNMPSIFSSHDSLSENTKTKQAFSEKCQDSKCLEGLDDNINCINRPGNTNLVSCGNQINSDKINISSSSASVSLFGEQESRNAQSVDISGSSEILSKYADVPEKLSECGIENVDSSLTKEREPIIVSGEKSLPYKDELLSDTAKVSQKMYPKSEADADNDVSVAEDGEHKRSAHDGLHEKVVERVNSLGISVPQPEDESDESDVIEHDVKVCDICGDAGQEKDLAICSRCIDGAEHTYCMREKPQEFPKGDWLCEECQCAEETAANQRLDVEGKNSHKVGSSSQISGKRSSEIMEVAEVAKRRALESSTGSPKASSPRRLVPLSRESSFKNLDNGMVKPGQTSRRMGSLLKCSSFNNFNSKSRGKLDDDVRQKQKVGGGEHVSKNMEIPGGTVRKSMSFKSSNLGRATVSKVKMLSSKSGTSQDLKGSSLAKESAVFDRKSLSKIDRPVVCSTMASSVISTSKHDQEFKVNHVGKSSSLSKPVNKINNKIPEPQAISGRTSTSVYETQQDGLPRLRETANQVDKTKDSYTHRMRSGTSASTPPFCHKCKDHGHATECCTVGGTHEFGADRLVTSTSSSKELHKGSRLKAALQAAMLKRPEIHKKKYLHDQSATSDTVLKCKVSSQDQVEVSAYNTLKKSISVEETNVKHERQNSTFETSKCLSVNDLNHIKTDLCSQLKNSDSISPSEKPAVRDLPNHVLAISSVTSEMSAVPEYKYIWQGVFEVSRSGKSPNLYTGIQAHLSSCASPKVLDVVNKILPEISLHEVSRLSTWPSHFRQCGAKEDNIALYFFAKDIESYERHYKSLLDHMIRHDLALKGFIDGVELLIFASNQLPENSQRWNMLFFLWGIFKGRRVNHSDSVKNIVLPSLNVAVPIEKDFPTAVMTLSDTRCSPVRINEESIACGKDCSELPATSIDQGHIMLSKDFDIKDTIVDQTHLGSQVNFDRQDSRINNTKSSSRISTNVIQPCREMNTIDSSLKEKGSLSEHGLHRESKSPEEAGTIVRAMIVETKPDYGISVKQENSLSSRIPFLDNQEILTANSTLKDKISERTNNDENQRRPKRKEREDDLNINVEATFQGDLALEAVNCQLPNDIKVAHIDHSNTVMEAPAASCQEMPRTKMNRKLEDTDSSSKLQSGFSGVYGCHNFVARDSLTGSSTSLVNDFGSSSSVEDKGCKESCDEKIIHEDLGTMEKTFFPIDRHNTTDSRLVLNSMSMKGSHECREQFEVGIPSLELALGGEIKQSKNGTLPFLAGQADKKNNQEKTPDCLEAEQEDDDSLAASLSLSLSFPSSNKETTIPASKDEHHMNSSLLLFGRFTDK
ncbi:uncharacterized protein LOC123924542 isoform X2 [Trifolium pratense]|uniref:uncharacterized protein LOC123924542 isoform X2 n=1 Tax=Trifolium pratense TaxID=57577 RepID=UPI001E696D9D|nr:uncharacterized protein LOC123924542 isoform X2 [Trifolium pratense]XP_045833429.1 uncharacterized protein LOC123924542 isoform X2 [Trifolium pratense]XP_045833430.1 uncharacterized protein LOC123924542 isoform X2 [Trifolium pratense]XP_045833431.1 uncharacterized protein LOC123924542 isoform X2 [Trifolium pratense]